jgi:hypothetical protein
MLCRIVWYVLTDVSEGFTAMSLDDVAVSTSEMSVSIYQNTQRNIPEDSHLHIRRHENLKSHQICHPV